MRTWVWAFGLLTLLACGVFKGSRDSKNKLEFTEGGGFTGQFKSWYLTENGQVSLKNPFDTLARIVNGIEKKKAKEYFQTAKVLFQPNKKWPNEPSNYYRHIVYTYNGTNHTATWVPGSAGNGQLDSFFMQVVREMEGKNIIKLE